jgi:glycosyltransferase involved in cell wall biosynthesis
MNKNESHVVVCIPYYKCQSYIRRAVESVLSQTHRNLTVAVLNDADITTPPWPTLADINDPRLVRFDLSKNRGPYFALEVLLRATSAPYLLIQDADDRSHPERVTRLLDALEKDRSDLAVSQQPQFRLQAGGPYMQAELRWHRSRNAGDAKNIPFLLDPVMTPEFKYRAPHAGLIRTKTAKALGGYYGGFRVTSDVLLTNAILMTGKVSHVALPLYHRFIRNESLTHSHETGLKSVYAAEVKAKIAALYNACYKHYQHFLEGAMTSGALVERICSIRSGTVSKEDRALLKTEMARLIKQYPNL